MALPMSRVLEIDLRAVEVLKEYRQEIQKAIAKGDLMRIGEIRACADWVNTIIRMANKPYVDKMNLSEDVLRSIGFLDNTDPKTPPASGRYPWGEIHLEFDDEDS